MRTTFTLIGMAGLLAGNLLAGPETIIKQRAKDLRDQNNARQGVAPSQPGLPAPSAPAVPSLWYSLTRFQTDLAAIQANATVTTEQKQKLKDELLGGAQGTKPLADTAAKLADQLAAAFVQKPLSAASRARLMTELDAVLNPDKYPQARLEGIFNDVQAMFLQNGLSREKAAAIADSVKSLSAEVRKGG